MPAGAFPNAYIDLGNPRWLAGAGFSLGAAARESRRPFPVADLTSMTSTSRRDDGWPALKDQDIETMLVALARSKRRVQRVVLSGRTIWIKRYAARGLRPASHALSLISRLAGMPGLRPSPQLEPEGMVERECRQIAAFRAHGFLTPDILYRSHNALVLSDLGPSVATQLADMRHRDPQGHDALVARCGLELGRVHAANLCHGRPHPRDFALNGDRFGFFDFEEEPAAVMPLDMAQARDLWLLFLDTASRSLSASTAAATLAAWRRSRPESTEVALAELTRGLARFLPLVHLALHVQAGRDLQRFVQATEFLTALAL